jgi:transposase InsO family protein
VADSPGRAEERKHLRRVGVMGLLRICFIAGRMKRSREPRQRSGVKALLPRRDGPSHPAVGTHARAEVAGDRNPKKRRGGMSCGEALDAVEQAVLARLPEGSRDAGVTLTTDNGTQFTSTQFIETENRLGITHRRTAYNHPEGNSYIERFHRSLKEEEVWTAEYRNLQEARTSIARKIEEYNHDRPHRGVRNRTSYEAFLSFAAVQKMRPGLSKLVGRHNRHYTLYTQQNKESGGEGGIRTHGRISPTHAFQACSLNRSDTSPHSRRATNLINLAESSRRRTDRHRSLWLNIVA